MERIILQVNGTRREYLLKRPQQRGASLVVFLHGTGATAAWADEETGWSALAEEEGFALALPEGLPPHPNDPPKFLTNPPRWDDGSPGIVNARSLATERHTSIAEPVVSSLHEGYAGPHSSADVAFLATVIDDAVVRVNADPRRVFVCGFSNGAAMAFRVAAELADKIAAVAPVAGHCWVPDPKPIRPVPTFYLIGSADPLIPLRGGEVRSPWQHRYVRRPPIAWTLERWADAIGCEVIPRTVSDSGGVRTDTYSGPVPFRVLTIEGLGHHWPGGLGRFNHRIAGLPSELVDGTRQVWEFCKQFAHA